MRKCVLSVVCLGLFAGSAPAQPPAGGPPPPGPGAPPPRAGQGAPPVNVFISPMGEPFRRAQGPGEPIDRWFRGVDTDNDGALSVTEFQADALRFFATLDGNSDGEIAPDEMIRYETQVAPEVQMGLRMRIVAGNRGRRVRERPGDGPYGMGSQALLNIPQPVISADADLNRGVSTVEFRHTAGQRFLLIDRNRDGRITRDELSPPPEEDRRRR